MMRLSHVAVLAMLALSVVVDGLIPFPLPDSGGRDRSGLAAPDPEVSLVYYAAVKADETQAPTQDMAYLRPGPAVVPAEHAGEPPLAQPNMEVSDVLGRDTAGTGADRNNLHPGDGAAGDGSVGMRGIATYYHPSLHGAIMADGRTFNEWDPTIVASNDFELGSVLQIEYRTVITAVVSDRGGGLRPGQVDLSRAGFVALMGSTQVGRVEVSVRAVE